MPPACERSGLLQAGRMHYFFEDGPDPIAF